MDKYSSDASKVNPSGMEFSLHTVLLALRCWWKLVIPSSILLASLAGAVVFITHKPIFKSTALLFIKEKPDVILRDVQMDSRKFIQNQMQIITSHRLLSPLASKPDVLTTPELTDQLDVATTLAMQLVIRPRGQSDMYEVSFVSEKPEKAQLVVKEVVEAYLAFNRKISSEQDNQIIRLLEEQRTARYEEMNQLRENVRQLSKQLTGIDPYLANNLKSEENSNTKNFMAQMQTDIVKDEVELDILSAHIKAEQEKQANQKIEIPLNEIERQLEIHPNILAMHSKLDELRLKEADFMKSTKNLATNPAFESLRNEIASKTEGLETLKQRLRDEIQRAIEKQEIAKRQAALDGLQAQYHTTSTKLKILSEKFKTGMGTAKQFAGDSLELEFRRAKLEQVTKIHDEISTRILAITTEQRAPERVELYQEPRVPTRPEELVPWKKIGLASGLALLIPMALAVLWEHIFRRVNNRHQVEVANQLTVVGEVTSLPTKNRRSSMGKSAQREILLFEESVDSLRTCLSLMESLRGLKILSVTSAVSGEGKTSLSAQLAVSIARATGEPTLLIDGDMRAPDVHDIFSMDLSPGLVEVLKGECAPEDAIETSFSDSLHVLTAGRLKTSPHRLLSSGEFPTLLEQLSKKYRHIIIDTPPILPASESLVLSRAADATVLCMRRDYSRLDQTKEAYGRMVAAGVRTAGAVLNGIPMKQYTYKYGSYGYYETYEDDVK